MKITVFCTLALTAVFFLALNAVPVGYAGEPNSDSGRAVKEPVVCEDPRPQICTQDYRPVCALLEDGSRKTYANGCNACADPAVTEHREGACE